MQWGHRPPQPCLWVMRLHRVLSEHPPPPPRQTNQNHGLVPSPPPLLTVVFPDLGAYTRVKPGEGG